MGILADIFVATPENALRYEAAVRNGGDMSPFERVEYKGLTAELRPIVHDLRRLALSARRSGNAMYLWGSL